MFVKGFKMYQKIDRRTFIKYTGLGLSALSMSTLNFDCTHEKENRPNILLFVADDTGWRDVGYHDSEIETPVIDNLAREGVELNQFYAYPICSPIRSALL